MKDSIVYLDQVSKIYPSTTGEVYAVRDVTIAVQPGEFFSLLGSSGSGKTTTLRLIGGFEIPEYGEVSIGGETVTTLPPYRRNVHTVFQNYALFPHLTVAQNIAYPLTIAKIPQKVPKSEIADRVQEALRMVRITELTDRKPAQLSGGQQQRVALARALISRPKVLLLDEPLSALDAKIREEVRQELRQLQKQIDLTFIYVTHDQEEALALSDRIAVMSNGQVEQIGTPKEIYSRPASPFVAQFIGKANFLTGQVIESNSEFTWVKVNNTNVKAIAPTPKPAIGETVTLMIRPEQLKLVNVENPDCDNHILGKLKTVTYIGQLLELHFDTAIGQLKVTQLGNTGTSSEQAIGWNAEDCVVVPNVKNHGLNNL
jgi:spermidine/putrescine ABC transporter ATP-binding subunit